MLKLLSLLSLALFVVCAICLSTQSAHAIPGQCYEHCVMATKSRFCFQPETCVVFAEPNCHFCRGDASRKYTCAFSPAGATCSKISSATVGFWEGTTDTSCPCTSPIDGNKYSYAETTTCSNLGVLMSLFWGDCIIITP